jgi:hypothetical protein
MRFLRVTNHWVCESTPLYGRKPTNVNDTRTEAVTGDLTSTTETSCLISQCAQTVTARFAKGCYRFTATPDEYRQSYAKFEPYSINTKHGDIEETTHNCLHLMPNADFMRNSRK